MKGQKVVVEPHRHPGVFVARGKEDLLITRNLTPGNGGKQNQETMRTPCLTKHIGESVYGEKRIAVPATTTSEVNGEEAAGTTIEYRVWNPFRSKLAAGILGGMVGFCPNARRRHLSLVNYISIS